MSDGEKDSVLALLEGRPQVIQGNVEAFVDIVKYQFSINALKMLVTVTKIGGVDSDMKGIVAKIGSHLSPALSETDASEKALKQALAVYVMAMAGLGQAHQPEVGTQEYEAAEALSDALVKYYEDFNIALAASVDGAAAFVKWSRRQAYKYYRTEKAFQAQHPDVKEAMLHAGTLLLAVEMVVGQLALIQPYLLVIPTTLEIGKKIGDTAVVEALAWMDSRNEEKINKAWSHIVAGEGEAPLETAWELLKSPENITLGTGAANDAGTMASLLKPLAEPMASGVGAGLTGVGSFLQVFAIGMYVSDLAALEAATKGEHEEPALSAKQKEEVALLREATVLAFGDRDKGKLRLWAAAGVMRIRDEDTGEMVIVSHDGTPVKSQGGSALYGLEFAKIRYQTDGFTDVESGECYLADWEKCVLGTIPADRSAGYPFQVFMVAKNDEVGYSGIVRINDDGRVVSVENVAEAPDPGFKKAVENATQKYHAVCFDAPLSSTTTDGKVRNRAGFVFDWSTAKYRSGATFLGRIQVGITTDLAGAECILTLDPDGNCNSNAVLGSWVGGHAVDAETYLKTAFSGLLELDAIEAGQKLDQDERDRPARLAAEEEKKAAELLARQKYDDAAFKENLQRVQESDAAAKERWRLYNEQQAEKETERGRQLVEKVLPDSIKNVTKAAPDVSLRIIAKFANKVGGKKK